MKILIIGGAGFIGCNAAAFFYKHGHEIFIIDNLSRKGSENNLKWLNQHIDIEFFNVDMRNYSDILRVLKNIADIDVVIHLAAQVAVTTSVIDPREDFEINALGSFNVLEAIREVKIDPIILYSSTNKVYGNMDHIEVVKNNGRYQYKNISSGIPENQLLDFHSPYGCSKGAADQYFIDYARIYNMRTIVLRQSCIFGYHQFGVEDQGWVAWFTIAAALNKPLTIYGDGYQVRDVLFIEDLVNCYKLAIENISSISGNAYNIGGGPTNQMSLLELIGYLEELMGKKIQYSFDDWRPGDQRVFVCNIDKAKNDFDWAPQTNVKEGVHKLYHWVTDNLELLQSYH